MKNNQFALLPVDSEQAQAELRTIKFIDEDVDAIKTVPAVYQALLYKAFPESEDTTTLNQKLAGILAIPTQDLASWLTDAKIVTADVFYRVALQLLEFLPVHDFDMANPFAAYDKMNLPTVTEAEFDRETLLHAWYLLLNTHSKNGKSFIDRLATRGYFAPFIYELDTPRPLFFNGKAQPVYDTNAITREVVYVETDFDSDHDGHRDLLKVEILRPVESTEQQVPVLYTSSPYNQGTNDEDGEKLTHNVDVPLTRKAPKPLEYTTIEHHDDFGTVPAARVIADETEWATESFAREQSYTLNDYFLARGFAAVYAAGIGSLDSDGLQTTGDEYEVAGAKAVVEWLHGDRVAFTNKTDNIAIKAWWSNGKIAMTGRSYLGTLATAVATTGVAGLETIVSEAAISSWYDYYRSNGLVIAADGFPGEDADVLAEETFSRRKQPGDFLKIADEYNKYLAQMGIDQDRETGSYNEFWDARNYLKNVDKIKADVLMVHGLNDWNVKPEQVNNLWHALDKANVGKKIILHQGEHIYINAMRSIDYTDMINLWFSHKLYDLDNHADELLPNVIVQDNVQPETWTAYADWDARTNPQKFNLHDSQLSATSGNDQPSQFNDQLADSVFKDYTKNVAKWENDLKHADSPMAGHRLIFKTKPTDDAQIIDGRVHVHVKVASSADLGLLSFQLVDYGDAKRFNISPSPLRVKLDTGFHWREDALNEFTLAKPTPFKMITKGHINLQNRTNAWQSDDLQADEFVELDLELQPTFYQLPAGHQLGLVVYATDFGMTVRGNQDITYSLDETWSYIEVPTK